MSYKNKTYIIFDADTDIAQYRMMTAWKANDRIDFNFHDAHDLNVLTAQASDDQIKRKLRERMKNSKQAIVLVGENTKNLYKFVRWEIEIALAMDIPIIAVNLDKSNDDTSKTPAILKDNCFFLNVPYDQKKIKYALDNFPDHYGSSNRTKASSLAYNWNKIQL